MKNILKLFIFGMIVIAFSFSVTAQTNFTQTMTYHVNDKGSASVELTQKMNAQQWQMFKSNINASNMAVKKRDMERTLPTAVLTNFKYSDDDIERTSKFAFDMDGIAEYNGNNQWTIKLESKNPQIEKLTDNSYMLTSSTTTFDGGVYQVIQKVHLPGKATSIEVNKDAFGMAKIDYDLKSESGGVPVMLIGGGLLTLAGAGLFVFKPKPKIKTASA